MARLDEIGEGVANVLLHSTTPEPLAVTLSNHTPAEIAFFVNEVVIRFEGQKDALAAVVVPEEAYRILAGDPGFADGAIGGTLLRAGSASDGVVQFYRQPM